MEKGNKAWKVEFTKKVDFCFSKTLINPNYLA